MFCSVNCSLELKQQPTVLELLNQELKEQQKNIKRGMLYNFVSYCFVGFVVASIIGGTYEIYNQYSNLFNKLKNEGEQ